MLLWFITVFQIARLPCGLVYLLSHSFIRLKSGYRKIDSSLSLSEYGVDLSTVSGPPVRTECVKPGMRLPGDKKGRVFKLMLSCSRAAGAEVRRICREVPGMGTHKLHGELKTFLLRHRIKLGRDRLHLLLKEHGMLAKNKASKVATTEPNHPHYKCPNVANDLKPTRVNKLWPGRRCGERFDVHCCWC